MTATRFFAAPDAQHQATSSGAHQAFLLLRTVSTIAPIAFGPDKFFDLLTDGSNTSPRGSTTSSWARRMRRCWPSAW